ncbi:DNA invertase Pin-like site-specific DNA recombinase, partial [Roseomonas alkaliterrae]|nr:DNA invertase Pin-like site-specific DNA recombinase [Neoroseomonas alkaliterrae]
MSTDHQRYSTENQSAAIRKYAEERGIEIVRTYADHGKSGLSLAGRSGLKSLIDDVRAGRADFDLILVYDVSRWGRFQDADESAFYEYQCRKAGIQVEYCIDGFENDGSPVATIVKGVKRALAGEGSRLLSVRVFAGQGRLIELGFRQGGPAGFGLRRYLLDGAGNRKAPLTRGEQKSLQTDRVILVPGPAEEVDAVRWIYRSFVEEGRSENEIATLLNAQGISTDLGRPWTRGTVHQVLINEKYVGDNVWNRISCKLQGARVRNRPDMWIRRDGAFEPLVDRMLFEAAQIIIRERSRRLTDEEMLEVLRTILANRGYLSGLVIDEGSRPSTWWKKLVGLRWPRVRRPWAEVAGFRWW